MLSTDPIDLALDPSTGDLLIASGRLSLTSGVAAVVQGIRIRLQLIAGEWFLDLDAGVRYFPRDGVDARLAIFGAKFDETKAAREFRAAILATPGVLAVTQLAIDFDGRTRAMSVRWQASTVFGDTPADVLALGR